MALLGYLRYEPPTHATMSEKCVSSEAKPHKDDHLESIDSFRKICVLFPQLRIRVCKLIDIKQQNTIKTKHQMSKGKTNFHDLKSNRKSFCEKKQIP